MRQVRIFNKTRGSVLGTAVRVADTWWSRTRGYLWRTQPAAGEGLLLNPCRGLHMVGMSYPLDAVFVGAAGEVVALHSEMRPGSRTPLYRSAEYAIELPAGTIEASGTRERDIIAWTPAEAPSPVPDWQSVDRSGATPDVGAAHAKLNARTGDGNHERRAAGR